MNAGSEPLVKGIVDAIADGFAEILHARPSQDAVDSLQNVMFAAVKLSIKLRSQEAEYEMVWPADKQLNIATMEDDHGEELEKNRKVLQLPLFPMLRKKADDWTEEVSNSLYGLRTLTPPERQVDHYQQSMGHVDGAR